MKLKKNFKVIAIITVLIIAVAARLMSNKEDFNREQKLASESFGAVPVIMQTSKYQTVQNHIEADGTFKANQEVAVAAEISGKVISLSAEVGDQVSAGQVLATLDHSILDIELEQATANLQKLEKDLQRNKVLLKTDGATAQQVEQSAQDVLDARTTLANLQNDYDHSFIKAPFNGSITKRLIENGSFVSLGSETFNLISTANMRLIVKVTADEVGKIEKGQAVSVSVDDVSEENIRGTVLSINEKANQSKQYEVEIAVSKSSNSQLKPGMFGKAFFSEKADSSSLVIPRVAIPGSIKNGEIYLVKGDTAILTRIVATPLNEKEVVVTKGLNEGDVFVVSGQINLTNGTKVKSIQ